MRNRCLCEMELNARILEVYLTLCLTILYSLSLMVYEVLYYTVIKKQGISYIHNTKRESCKYFEVVLQGTVVASG